MIAKESGSKRRKLRSKRPLAMVALLGVGGLVAALRQYGSVTGVVAAVASKVKATAAKAKRANRK